MLTAKQFAKGVPIILTDAVTIAPGQTKTVPLHIRCRMREAADFIPLLWLLEPVCNLPVSNAVGGMLSDPDLSIVNKGAIHPSY